MDTVFGTLYSFAYDTLYQEKDYEKECDYLAEIFRACQQPVSSVLDLGCGTGRHDVILASRGYNITGVDRSAEMLRYAQNRVNDAGVHVNFIKSDLVDYVPAGRSDAVISMFAVLGYLETLHDLFKTLCLARCALRTGGVFVFDAWNGLCVLKEQPRLRTVEKQYGSVRIVRTTEPSLDPKRNCVYVKFTLSVFNGAVPVKSTTETHRMRYFFPQELTTLLVQAGFSSVRMTPFLQHEGRVDDTVWNMSVVAQA